MPFTSLMPSEYGGMLESVSDTVPLVWMLLPLHGGYTITVCAAARDQVTRA